MVQTHGAPDLESPIPRFEMCRPIESAAAPCNPVGCPPDQLVGAHARPTEYRPGARPVAEKCIGSLSPRKGHATPEQCRQLLTCGPHAQLFGTGDIDHERR